MPKTADEYPHDPGSVDLPHLDLGASQGTIVKAAFRFWESKVLMSAVRLNVFEALASGPLDLPGLTRRVGVNSRGARDFFDALVALGYLLRREGDYMNAETTQRYLVRSRPNYLGGLLELADTRLFPVWDKLTDALKSGQPQNEAQQVPDYYSNLTPGSREASYLPARDDCTQHRIGQAARRNHRLGALHAVRGPRRRGRVPSQSSWPDATSIWSVRALSCRRSNRCSMSTWLGPGSVAGSASAAGTSSGTRCRRRRSSSWGTCCTTGIWSRSRTWCRGATRRCHREAW